MGNGKWEMGNGKWEMGREGGNPPEPKLINNVLFIFEH